MIDEPRPVPLETAREILRLSEVYLAGTVSGITALDTKATSLASMLATWIVALLGAASTLALGEHVGERNFVLAGAAATTAFFFLVALILAARMLQPKEIAGAGNYLANWNSEEDLYGSLAVSMMEQAAIYDDSIRRNQATSFAKVESLYTVVRLMIAAPLAGLVGGAMVEGVLRFSQ